MFTLAPSPQMNATQHEGIEVMVEAIIWEKMIFLHECCASDKDEFATLAPTMKLAHKSF